MEAACRPKRVEEALKLFEGTNSRATSSEEFKKYVLAHLKVQAQTRVFWCKPQRRIVRWQNWKGRRSADERFVERVVETFGAGAVIAYGSAAGWHAMKGHAPTPTTGLRRRMEVRPELLVIKTPEALTTKTCCRCVQQTLGPDRQRMTTTTNRSGVEKSFPARGIRRCNSASCEGRRWNETSTPRSTFVATSPTTSPAPTVAGSASVSRCRARTPRTRTRTRTRATMTTTARRRRRWLHSRPRRPSKRQQILVPP